MASNGINRRYFLLGAAASTLPLLLPKSPKLEAVPLDRGELAMLPRLTQPVVTPATGQQIQPPPAIVTPPPPPPGSQYRGRVLIDDDRPIARPYKPAPGLTSAIENRVWACFQRVIAFAEGTWYRGSPRNPYMILFTFKLATDIIPGYNYQDHPFLMLSKAEGDRVMPCGWINGEKVCSTAFGIGQAITTTWNLRQQQYPDAWFRNAPKAAPQNQDRFMQINAAACGAYWSLMRGVSVAAGRADVNPENVRQAIAKASSEWAGLPGLHGRSTLEQNAKPMDVLVSLFYSELKLEQAQVWSTTSPTRG